MKLRSAFFAFVLLLLTVTVCAAQSSMGFSPYEFYEDFSLINSILEGPECSYIPIDEENGDVIDVSDSINFNLIYSGDDLTDIYLFFNIATDDEDSWNTVVKMICVTFYTLAYKAEGHFDTIDFEEISDIIHNLATTAVPTDYNGYHFEFGIEEKDSIMGLLWVTKSDNA